MPNPHSRSLKTDVTPFKRAAMALFFRPLFSSSFFVLFFSPNFFCHTAEPLTRQGSAMRNLLAESQYLQPTSPSYNANHNGQIVRRKGVLRLLNLPFFQIFIVRIVCRFAQRGHFIVVDPLTPKTPPPHCIDCVLYDVYTPIPAQS